MTEPASPTALPDTFQDAGFTFQKDAAVPAEATPAEAYTHSLLHIAIDHLETIAAHMGANVAREIIRHETPSNMTTE